jgi:hypothetical protein
MDYLDTFERHIIGVADRYKKGDGAKRGRIALHCGTAIRIIEAWRADLAKIKHAATRDNVMFGAVSLMLLSLDIGEMAGREQRRISHTRAARAALRQENDTREKKLMEKILAEAASLNRAIAASEAFARQVHPGVCARLGVAGKDWPSLDTIKRSVSKYKRSKRG